MQPLFISTEIGELSGKTDKFHGEIKRLRDELTAVKTGFEDLKRENEAMKIENRSLAKRIRVVKSSREELLKDLERVKTANDQLRIEIEEKTVKNSKENQILTEKLEAVESENKELKRSLEELENKLASEIESNNSLQQTVDSIKEENQQIKDENKQIKDENKQINEKITELMKDNQDIKDENQRINNKLKNKETRLALGQVAYRLEAEIWRVVLPNEEMGYTGIFRSMIEWLDEHSSSPEGKKAQKRWDDLKLKLNWNEKRHKYGLKVLKGLRTKDAHPENVEPEAARKELKEGGHIAGSDKKKCEEIIDMLIIVQKLNSPISI